MIRPGAIRAAVAGASKAVIVGMGFIGAEVAASMRQQGLDVTVVEFFATPLERVLGPELGRAIEQLSGWEKVALPIAA